MDFSDREARGRPAGSGQPSARHLLHFDRCLHNPESLNWYWGYDDSALVSYLAGAGFRVIENARGNATFTPVCLSTYLDMNYPPPPPAGSQSLASQVAYYCQFIRQAEAPSRLKASGYEMRMYSIFDVAGSPHFYTYPRITNPTLATVLWTRTALGHIHAYCVRLTLGGTNLKLFSLLPQIAAERSAAAQICVRPPDHAPFTVSI